MFRQSTTNIVATRWWFFFVIANTRVSEWACAHTKRPNQPNNVYSKLTPYTLCVYSLTLFTICTRVSCCWWWLYKFVSRLFERMNSGNNDNNNNNNNHSKATITIAQPPTTQHMTWPMWCLYMGTNKHSVCVDCYKLEVHTADSVYVLLRHTFIFILFDVVVGVGVVVFGFSVDQALATERNETKRNIKSTKPFEHVWHIRTELSNNRNLKKNTQREESLFGHSLIELPLEKYSSNIHKNTWKPYNAVYLWTKLLCFFSSLVFVSVLIICRKTVHLCSTGLWISDMHQFFHVNCIFCIVKAKAGFWYLN